MMSIDYHSSKNLRKVLSKYVAADKHYRTSSKKRKVYETFVMVIVETVAWLSSYVL